MTGQWGVRVLAVIGLVAGAAWAQPTPRPAGTPSVHRSACSLGTSMAAKLGARPMPADRAQQTCEMLVPAMADADRADFMHCCAARLQKGAEAATPAYR